MIALLRGAVVRKSPTEALLDVNGVGYRVFITLASYETLPPEGGKAVLFIETIVRDDAIHLYGFVSEDEKVLFKKLLSVSKVGPKLAVQALSGMSTERLSSAIASEDANALSRLPGIGRKTADRIVMELKDKVGTSLGGSMPSVDGDDALSALENLGYKRKDAQTVLEKVMKEEPGLDLASLIRASLKLLSPHK